jgi:hypothetical protein
MTTNTEHRRVAGVNPLAIKLAAKLPEEFFESADMVFDADLVKKTSAVVILPIIKSVYTRDERKVWPRLDAGRVDGEVDYTCNNPDWTKAMNGKRTVWVSFFDTIVLRSAKAMAITSQIENVETLAKAEGKTSGGIGIKLDRDSDVATLEAKLSSYKNTFRKAIRLMQAEEAAAEYYPEMKFSYRKDTDGGIKQCAEPIMAYPQELPLLGENFTVTQFTGLDFKAVQDSGETDPEKRWQILLATKAKGTSEDEDDEDNIEINNYKRFETGAASMLYYLEQAANTTKLYSTFDKAKEITSVADFIKTLVELAVELGSIAQHLKAPRKGGKGSLYEQAMAASEQTEEEAEAETIQSAEVYSPENYIALEIGQYRTDYPAETKGMSDEYLFNLVMSTTDDMEPAAWKALLKANPQRRIA